MKNSENIDAKELIEVPYICHMAHNNNIGKKDSEQSCPLCNGVGSVFYSSNNRLYYQCGNCRGVFVDKNLLPQKDEEELRYNEHNNDVNDKGYQKFVLPITSAIMEHFAYCDKGLDFGAGTGPVISKVLSDNNFDIKQYDPFFHNYPELLNSKYNYIACCEVMEHFHYPMKEFGLLKDLLLDGGKLYCFTHIYDSGVKFDNWYYKNDLTHVFFYHKNSILWIKDKFGFSDVSIDGKLITFSN